jgi:hypothetical protein
VTTLDVLILIPVIPLLPVIATWFLPWEDWLPKKVPKFVLGPYLLYAAFAAWHFKLGFIPVTVCAGFGAILSVAAVLEKVPAYRDLHGPPPLIFPRPPSSSTPDLDDEHPVKKTE